MLTRRATDGQTPDPTRARPSEDSPVRPSGNTAVGPSEQLPVKEVAVRREPPAPTRPERPADTSARRTAAPVEDDFFTSGGHDPVGPDGFRPSPRPRLRDTEAPKQSVGQFIKELPVLIVVALAIAIIVKTFVMQAFFIPSGSMENTLEVGDRVLVAKFLYRFVEPKHPDVVVFVSPVSPPTPEPERNLFGKLTNEIAEGLGLRSSEQDFIKRVIATEGQTVEVKVGSVFVNNQQIDEPYRHDMEPLPDYGPTVVPPGTVFVMGDNRSNSEDSRVFGPIAKSSIVGRAFVLIWPLDRVSWLGG
jgi:signal peptidase I